MRYEFGEFYSEFGLLLLKCKTNECEFIKVDVPKKLILAHFNKVEANFYAHMPIELIHTHTQLVYGISDLLV